MPEAHLVKQWMRGFTYKPDWIIEVEDRYHYHEVGIKFFAKLPDVNSVKDFKTATLIPWQQIQMFSDDYLHSSFYNASILYGPVGASMTVPPNILEKMAFYSWLIGEAIPIIEGHETLEWARVDGKPIFDPHPNGGSASRPNIKTYMLDRIV